MNYIRFLPICLILSSPCWSQVPGPITVRIQCAATTGYTADEKVVAETEIKKAIISDYFKKVSATRRRLIDSVGGRTKMLGSPDEYLMGLSTESVIYDAKTKRLSVTGSSAIRLDAVDALIDDGARGLPKVPIVFVFVARRQSSVEEHGIEVTTGVDAGAGASVTADANSRSASASAYAGQRVSTGSSTTRRADTIVYDLEMQLKATIARSLTKGFRQRGLSSVPSSELFRVSKGSLNLDELQKDFRTSSEFSEANKDKIVEVCRQLEKPAMLAYGTLTIMAKRAATGGTVASVDMRVDAQVLDCRGALVEEIASVGNVVVTGFGADQTAAEADALDRAAERASADVADEVKRYLMDNAR